MTAMPNLFLKWRLFRELYDLPRSDREIAIEYWGPNEGPSRFSKMLRGDYGVSADAAAMLAGVINRRIETWRSARSGLGAGGQVTGTDIGLPTASFVQRLIAAAGGTDPEAEDRAHRLAMEILAPEPAAAARARLHVERFSKSRVFAPFEPAGGAEAVVFDPRTDLGQLVVELPDAPPAPPSLYVMVRRDAAEVKKRFWEVPFSETVWWLPSPFPAAVERNRIALMEGPQPLVPLPGHYHATAVVVMDPAALARLDPRTGGGDVPVRGHLDEQTTLRFLINLARVANRDPGAVLCASGDYRIAADTAAEAE